MKRLLTACTIVAVLTGLAVLGVAPGVAARVTPGQAPPRAEIAQGKITVLFADDVQAGRIAKGFGGVSVGIASVDHVLNQVKASDIKPIFPNAKKPAAGSPLKDLTQFYELAIPEEANVAQVAVALLQNPHIRHAEPVWQYYVDATPNDPQYANQWHMSPPGPDPHIYEAWDLERGSDSIKIAIVDTGVLYRHADLAGNIWVNPGEDLDGDEVVYDADDFNGVDDDGNGYVDDVIGYDFVASISSPAAGEDGSVRDNDPKDFNGHGTHVAGIAAAMNNNNTNVTGMAGGWYGGHRSFRGCRIMCLRAGGSTSSGLGTLNSNDIAAALNYAIDNDAHVINGSWGGGSFSLPVATAIGNAISAGIDFIHSAGNDNVDVESWHDQIPGVVSVANVNSSDQKDPSSNYGNWITVSAPGASILSTVSNGYTPGTAYYWGTSMSAPGVAGLAALIRSMMPSLPRATVDSILTYTTDNIDALNPGYETQLGTGRINAFTALSQLANAKFTADVTDANVPFTANFTDQSPNSPTSWDWSFGDGGTSNLQSPSHLYTVPGIYDVSLKVTEARGLGEEHLSRYVWARADTLALDSVMVEPGSTAVVNVHFRNTAQMKDLMFPFALTNTEGIALQSYEVLGTRAESFDVVNYEAYDDGNQKFAIRMTPSPVSASTYLQPGVGTLIKLYFTVPSTAAKGAVVMIDTVSQGFGLAKKPNESTIYGDFFPVFKAGKIVVKPCVRGKVLCGPLPINLVDLSTLISFLLTGSPVVDPYGGNINGTGIIDLADLSYLINYLVGGGPPPVN